MNTYRIYEKLTDSLGEKAAGALAGLLGDMFEELQNTVTKTDFADLKGVVAELAEAQKRTELKVEELAEAQKRTERGLEELRGTVAELAEAQKRTELKVEELAEAQKRTEVRMEAGFKDLHNRFGVLGSRWGDGAEEAFRQGLLETVRELGYTVSRFAGEDREGFINHTPRSYDLDILVLNGRVVAAEIKSNASGADVTEFHRCVKLYERQTGRTVDKAILVAVTLQQRAIENASELGVIVATDFSALDQRERT